MKQKEFFIIFKGISVAKNCVRLESAPLSALLSEDSLTAEPRPPVLIADTSISDNTSALSKYRRTPRRNTES